MIYEAHRKRETLFAKVMHNVLLNLQFEIELYEKLLLSYPQHSEVLRAGDGDFGTKNKLEKIIHHEKMNCMFLFFL